MRKIVIAAVLTAAALFATGCMATQQDHEALVALPLAVLLQQPFDQFAERIEPSIGARILRSYEAGLEIDTELTNRVVDGADLGREIAGERLHPGADDCRSS